MMTPERVRPSNSMRIDSDNPLCDNKEQKI